jgi:hypothetical protein
VPTVTIAPPRGFKTIDLATASRATAPGISGTAAIAPYSWLNLAPLLYEGGAAVTVTSYTSSPFVWSIQSIGHAGPDGASKVLITDPRTRLAWKAPGRLPLPDSVSLEPGEGTSIVVTPSTDFPGMYLLRAPFTPRGNLNIVTDVGVSYLAYGAQEPLLVAFLAQA